MKLITLLATAAAVLPLLTQAAPVPRQSNIIVRQEAVNAPSHAGAELRPRQEAPASEETVAPPLSPDTAYPTDGSDDAAGEEDKGPIAPADTTEGNGVQEETTPPTPPQDAPPQGSDEQSDVAYNNLEIDAEQGREANGPEDGSEPQEAGDNSYSAVGEEVVSIHSSCSSASYC